MTRACLASLAVLRRENPGAEVIAVTLRRNLP